MKLFERRLIFGNEAFICFYHSLTPCLPSSRVHRLQYTNAEEEGNGLAIPLPCKNDEGRNLTLEPISLIFMAIFGIALLVQFLAMFFHRMGTFLHIISSTEVGEDVIKRKAHIYSNHTCVCEYSL